MATSFPNTYRNNSLSKYSFSTRFEKQQGSVYASSGQPSARKQGQRPIFGKENVVG